MDALRFIAHDCMDKAARQVYHTNMGDNLGAANSEWFVSLRLLGIVRHMGRAFCVLFLTRVGGMDM